MRCSSLLEWHDRVFHPCELCFDSARLTWPCGLPV
ncbi:hypothetical protein F383_18055 [Gossypium arboreum]|uniref:Uncharacterized protein n=1 Tax=Gossypium arboreum TaxID=29729 RepID=A0A0B0NIK9_GOSAR|nr:hypothetical protein F383_18055 [Gossypium arboreum]